MITIKFPKSPRRANRVRVQDIGKLYEYTEDNFYSIIRIPYYNKDLQRIMTAIRWWKSVEISVDGSAIDTHEFVSILMGLSRKMSPKDLDWHDINFYRFKSLDEIKECLDDYLDVGFGDSHIDFDELLNQGIVSMDTSKEFYNVNKEEFIKIISKPLLLASKISKEFDFKSALDVINSLPDTIPIKEEEDRDPEGEEWIDWYDPIKYKKTVIDLLTKIEENTRKK